MRRVTLLALLLFVCALSLKAQDPGQFSQGFNAYQQYDFDGTSSVNLMYFSLFMHVPLASYPQRGKLPPITFSVLYNNPTWYNVSWIDVDGNAYSQWQPGGSFGPSVTSGPAIQIGETYVDWEQANGAYGVYGYYQAYATDDTGAVHDLYNAFGPDAMVSADGSGINVPASCPNPAIGISYNPCPILDSNGNLYAGIQGWYDSTTITDPDGNTMPNAVQYGWGLYGANTTFVSSGTDSVGRVFQNNRAAMAPTNPGCYPLTLPGQNGGTLTYSICYANLAVQSPFQSLDNSFNYGWSGSVLVMTQIVLPNNTSWSFSYDGYGNLTGLTLPTGGTESYAWTYGPYPYTSGGGGSVANQATITGRSENANDGTGPRVWQYNGGPGGGIVTDPDGDYTMYGAGSAYGNSIINEGNYALFPGETDTYSKIGTLLKKVTFQYPNPASTPFGSVAPSAVITTWPATGQVSEIAYTYDNGNGDTLQTSPGNPAPIYNYSNEKVTEKDEYDYGNGVPGTLLRKTLTSYLWQSNSSYRSANLLNLPASMTDQNGSGAQVALTNYGYDESPSPSGVRGNQTTVHRWLSNGAAVSTANCASSVSSGGYLTSYSVFNSDGTLHESTDACGSSAGDSNHTTTYGYSGTYAGAGPTSITNPKGQTEGYAYDVNTALLTSHTDANGQPTDYTYDDSMNRLTKITYLDGGYDTFSYDDAVQSLQSPNFTYTKAMTSGSSFSETGVVDGLARKIRTAATNGESVPYDQVDTCYDNEGRVGFIS